MDQVNPNPSEPQQKRIYRPHGLAEVVRLFGDIHSYIRTDGTISPEWERSYLGSALLPQPLPLSWDPARRVSSIRCHVLLVGHFEQVFQKIHSSNFWPAVHDYGGCYSFRTQRGSDSLLSLHAWGMAIDLNTTTNKRGTPGDMSPDVVRIFEENGFVWGRNFTVPDWQHFQFADGY